MSFTRYEHSPSLPCIGDEDASLGACLEKRIRKSPDPLRGTLC